jgi:putative sterol carrier protein
MSSEVRKMMEALPAAFLPEKAGGTQALLQLDLTGDGGSQWQLEVTDGSCVVREGTALSPDATITMEAGDFLALLKRQLDPVQAFMGGKIKINGNMGLVLQFLNWFKLGD